MSETGKPAYKKKIKTDNGYVWQYDESHIEKRWEQKREKIKLLEKNIKKVRKQYEKDLTDDDLRTRAIAAVVGIIDDTAMRVGNPESVEEHETYGATTLKVKHLNFVGSKVNFKFSGKDEVLQDDTVKNAKVIKVLKELIKKKKNDDFIFEVDGKKIWDRAINRYLEPFDISAKDLRGFHSNRLMKEMLKKKDWDDALEEVAEFIGHKPSTLKNQYLDPELVEKHEKKSKAGEVVRYISKRAVLLPDDQSVIEDMRQKYLGVAPSVPKKPMQDISQRSKTIAPTDIQQQMARLQIRPRVKLTPTILNAWLTLLPFLPRGARMTSGFRTPEDQVRILNNYWRKYTGETLSSNVDYAEVSRILKQKYGLIVGPPWTKNPYAHLKGNAFDVAGADLYEIAKAVNFVSNQPKLNIKLKAQIEEVNNAVHISVISAQYDAGAVREVASMSADDQFAKDEANKYEREKDDPKWDEVLIDDEKKWTRKEIRNHYVQNADKILKNIKGRPVMLYIGTEKNKNILKRHHNDKPIVINNKEDLEYWADRRMVGLHYVMGNKTKFGWIDLDLHDYPIEKAQSYAKKLVPVIKKELGATPEIWESGGAGLHIEFDLSKEWDIDDLREKLKVLLDEFNKDYPEVSTGIVKGKGMRSDISTLHEKGNLRVGHSLGESAGNVKKPLGKSASISVIHKWFADMSQKYG